VFRVYTHGGQLLSMVDVQFIRLCRSPSPGRDGPTTTLQAVLCRWSRVSTARVCWRIAVMTRLLVCVRGRYTQTRQERSTVERRSDGKPRKDAAGSDCVDDDVGKQEGRSVRQECLSGFHEDAIAACECNHKHWVSPSGEIPVVSCVRKRACER